MLKFLFGYSGDSCPQCGRVCPPLNDADFDDYFNGREVKCAHCRHSESAWIRLRRGLRAEHPLAPGAIGLGVAASAVGTLLLSRGETVSFDLAELGVPADAPILSVNFTPKMTADNEVLAPAMIHQSLSRGPIPHVLDIIGLPMIGSPDASELTVSCIWLNSNFETEMEPLVRAIEAFSNKEYRQAIIPAMVALEDELKSVLSRHYSQFAGADKLKGFLNNATLATQLDFLLPSLMALVNAPALTAEVKQRLGELKAHRDKVAHGNVHITGPQTADAILGAIFGFRYLRLYGGRLGTASGNLSGR